MDWNLYLTVASNLLAVGTEEAKRSCISRSYYAIYNQAKVKAGITGFENSESSHNKVWEALNKQGGDARKASMIGSMLKNQRKWADYGEEYPENLDLQSKIAVAQASSAIELLNSV